MKNLSFILIPFFCIALLFSSCTEQDACADITCLNGGTCDSGECDCPAGYSGELCATYDSCQNVICMNNGTCNNGICDCPTGYSGADCSTVLPSTKLTITKIVVNSYPSTRANGQNWDTADGADALVTFSLGATGSNSGYSSETINNVTGSALEFVANLPTNTGAAHTIDWNISLWDEDPSTRELISTIAFRPTAYSNGAPATFELSNNDINVTIHATWEF
ncbi:MAG: calcium-binding EGF-like domain-containing protein [Aureispira sp.]